MCAHPPHPKLEKTALGAFEYVPWTYYERNRDCIDALEAQGIPLVSIEVTPEAIPYPKFEWPSPVAIAFGNEVNGVNHRVLERSSAVVCIPMHGYKNSINVATAFGIILYDILGRWNCLEAARAIPADL
jgi:tRNA G18 (ribose-2'-O)-methylase SpoU